MIRNSVQWHSWQGMNIFWKHRLEVQLAARFFVFPHTYTHTRTRRMFRTTQWIYRWRIRNEVKRISGAMEAFIDASLICKLIRQTILKRREKMSSLISLVSQKRHINSSCKLFMSTRVFDATWRLRISHTKHRGIVMHATTAMWSALWSLWILFGTFVECVSYAELNKYYVMLNFNHINWTERRSCQLIAA